MEAAVSYGPFESLEASESEHRIAANAANKTLDIAIVQVKARHAAYLNQSADQHDFYDRLKNCKTSMREICQEHGVHPAAGVMNKVVKACRDEARPHWRKRQAATGTSVDDAAPPSDLSAPIGTLEENPIGAVASRRVANTDVPGYETQYGIGAGEVTNTTADEQQLASRRVGGGFRDYLQQGVRGLAEGMDPGAGGHGGTGAFMEGLDSGIEGQLPPEIGRPQHKPLPRGHDQHNWKQELMEGLQTGIGQGRRASTSEYLFGDPPKPPVEQAGGNEEFFHTPKPPKKRKPVKGPEYAQEGYYGSVSDRQYLAALITGTDITDPALGGDPSQPYGGGATVGGDAAGSGTTVDPTLVMAPDKWAKRMFADFDNEHHSLQAPLIPEGDFDAYLNQVTDPAADRASTEPFGERDGEHDWENTGKNARRLHAETLPHFKPLAPGEAAILQQKADARGNTGYNFTGSPETQYHHRQKGWRGEGDFDQDAMYRQQRAAAKHYHSWCTANRLTKRSEKNLHYFASRVSLPEATAFFGAIREAHAQKQYRTAAGKDHLQTSQDAITKMLNELAEDFQKSIMPLQDALQSVAYAQQAMAAQSPMNVMPPGTVNVMPEGMQDPSMMGGGAPPAAPMQGQGMPAQPGPGGLSPMVDPAATGGAPAAPAPGGGDPMAALPPEVLQALMGAGGGGAPAPQAAQRPVARRLQAEFPFGGGGDSEKKDDKPKDDGPPKDDKPSGDGPPSDSGDDKPPSDGPPEDQGPPAEGDGGGEAADKAAVVEAVVALLDAGDIETAQLLAQQFEITDADVNGFAPSDPYETGDPYGAPASAGPPPAGPPVDAGPPPPDAGPPPGPPPGPPMPDQVPPEIKAAAVQYLRWAARHNLPVSKETVAAFHTASSDTGFAKIKEQQQARAKRRGPAKLPTAAEILGSIARQDPELIRTASRPPLVTASR